MKIINFKSNPAKTPFAPEWNYFMAESNIKNVNFKKLFVFLKKKRKKYIKNKIK